MGKINKPILKEVKIKTDETDDKYRRIQALLSRAIIEYMRNFKE